VCEGSGGSACSCYSRSNKGTSQCEQLSELAVVNRKRRDVCLPEWVRVDAGYKAAALIVASLLLMVLFKSSRDDFFLHSSFKVIVLTWAVPR
jgi:hypothetical protein